MGPDDTNLLNVARDCRLLPATFDPDPSERNAATHRLDVGVTRDAVRVRARPEVIIPPAGEDASDGPPRHDGGRPAVLRAAAARRGPSVGVRERQSEDSDRARDARAR